MENQEFKKVRIKNRTCYYFDDIIKLEDFAIDNIWIDEKHTKIFLFVTFHLKLSLVQNLCVLDSIK